MEVLFEELKSGILKPDRFWGILTRVFFFFSKAKNSIIAVATISFFNTDKEKKDKTKNRKAVWFGYISAREDSRAFGAMIEKRITDNWKDICTRNGFELVDIPGRRTIFDFACKIDGELYGFDVKTKDLDSKSYSDGGVCAVGNLLKFLANDKGVFMVVEFGHDKSTDKNNTREIEYMRVAPFHTLPSDTYRIENLGTGQVRMKYTLNQVWSEIDWDRSYSDFFDIFCSITIKHYNRVKADAEKRIQSITEIQRKWIS